jgi:hypothetical protein
VVRVEEESVISSYVLSVIDSLKKKITADRFIYIKVLCSYIFVPSFLNNRSRYKILLLLIFLLL